MQKNPPKVSVVMATYNRADIVPRAIESILNQTFKDFEFIIVNDGSTDGTQTVLETYVQKDTRVKIVVQKNEGPARARNHGVQHAKGKYIAFMDDDDLSLPARLGEQYKLLEEQTGIIDACVCYYKAIIKDKKNPRGDAAIKKERKPNPEEMKYSQESLKNLPVQLFSLSPMTMIARSVFVKCGGYRPFFENGEDLDFTLRFRERYRAGVVREYLYEYTSPFYNFANNMTTSSRRPPLRGIKYIMAAYVSAWYRSNRGTDPINEASTLEDVIGVNTIGRIPADIRRHIFLKCIKLEMKVFFSDPHLSCASIITLIRFLQRWDRKMALQILYKKKLMVFRSLLKRGQVFDILSLCRFGLMELFLPQGEKKHSDAI